MRKYILFIFLITCLSITSSCQTFKELPSKVIIDEGKIIFPISKDTFKALVHYESLRDDILKKKEYTLPIGIGRQFNQKIKYTIYRKNFLALSIDDSSLKLEGKNTNFQPIPVAISLDKLTLAQISSYNQTVENNKRTGVNFESIINFNREPIIDFYRFFHKEFPLYHDFTTTEQEVLFIYQSKESIKVWSYSVSDKNLQDHDLVVPVRKIDEYKSNLEEDFYVFYISDKLFLVTEQGDLFCLSSEFIKIKNIGNLIQNTLIIDKDNNKIFLIHKKHLNKLTDYKYKTLLKSLATEIGL